MLFIRSLADKLTYPAPTARALIILGDCPCDLRGLAPVTLGGNLKGLSPVTLGASSKGLELALNFHGAGLVSCVHTLIHSKYFIGSGFVQLS